MLQQLSKPNAETSEALRDTWLDVAAVLGDEYTTLHVLPQLLVALQRHLFSRVPATPDDGKVAGLTLRILTRVVELPAAPLRLAKTVLLDQPLLLALLVYPQLYDHRLLFGLVVDALASVARAIGDPSRVAFLATLLGGAASGIDGR